MALWKWQMYPQIQSTIAGMSLKENMKPILQLADAVDRTIAQKGVSPLASLAAIDQDETEAATVIAFSLKSFYTNYIV